MKNRVTVIRVLEALKRMYGLSGETKECIEQAKQDVLAMHKMSNTEFMQNALNGEE